MPSGYQFNVFINCPFDDDYAPLFDALVFTVIRCGFNARCAREVDNAVEGRFSKKDLCHHPGLSLWHSRHFSHGT
jgi:hypothetical protein